MVKENKKHQVLLQSDDPQHIIRELCEKVLDFLGCHVFFNYIVDEQSNRLHLNACSGINESEKQKIEWLDDRIEVCGCAALERKRIVAEDVMNITDSRMKLIKSYGIQAYCCHPLMIRDKLIGTLSFGTRTRIRFSSEEIEVMKSLADLVAIAMDRINSQGQIKNLARFPEENPYPVLRINADGTIIYSNMPGQEILNNWDRRIGQKVPDNWLNYIDNSLRYNHSTLEYMKCGQSIFSIAVTPVQEAGYVNLYGRDITIQEQIKDELRKSRDELDVKVHQRTTELAKNIGILRKEINDRITAQAQLKERTKVLDAFFAYSITPLVILDREFNFIRVNKAYADGCQKNIDDFTGHNHFEFYPNEENERIFKQVVATKKSYQAVAKQFSFPDRPELGVTYWDWTLVPILGDDENVEFLVFSLKDVTERNLAENRNRIMAELLEQFVTKSSRKEYLDSVVKILRDWSGCRCVGIRLINSDGFIPYASCVGFSEKFISLESNLCLNKDACACIRVISQKNEPQDTSVMTEKGSFHCGNSLKFVEALSGNEKKRFRGNCIKAGFATLSIVPIRYREEILGAIHIADEGENKVSFENVKFLEDMAALIGEAVHRFNVEEALVLNEQRLLNAQRVTHIGNWELDVTKNRLWWSDEVYRIAGLEPKRFAATLDAFLSIVHPEDRELVKESINKALYEGQAYDIDHRLIKSDGSLRIVNERGEVIFDSQQKPVKMIGTVHDITERKEAENEIRKNQKELRTMAAQLQLAEEQERRRIAQDLHDSIGQILSFSGRELKFLQKMVPEKEAKAIGKIASQLDLAVTQARTLSFDLSPSILYDLGFEVAVEDLVDKFCMGKGIKCSFNNSTQPKPLTDDVKVLLYRSIRELLINAAKYSKAEHVKVSIFRSSSDIYIKVEDNGCGFDISILNDNSTKRKGFGIFSIQERLKHIGGKLNIESVKGRGTTAVIIAPLDIGNEKQ